MQKSRVAHPKAIDVKIVLAPSADGVTYTPIKIDLDFVTRYRLFFRISQTRENRSSGNLTARLRANLARPLQFDKALQLLDGFGVDPHRIVARLEAEVRSASSAKFD
jgi:hypothetical protein